MLIEDRPTFGPNSSLTCQVTVTAQTPPDTSRCQGAAYPPAGNPQLINAAYMDLTKNYVPSNEPIFSAFAAADLPFCRSVIVTKTATQHDFGPGVPVTYTITAENKGKDPLGSFVLKDDVPTSLLPATVSACDPLTACTSGPTINSAGQVNVNYGPIEPGEAHKVKFTLTATSPLAGGPYHNLAVGSFLPGGNFYFQGDEINFLQQEENIQVVTPTLSKLFNPSQIAPNAESTLTFNITNTSSDPKQTGIAFADTLPPGLQLVGVTGNNCGGSVTTSTDSHTATLTGGNLVGSNADGSGKHTCQISVKVKASSDCRVYENNTTNFSHVANLDVTNINQQLEVACATEPRPPTLSKLFDPTQIASNGTTTLTFNITNSSGDPKQTGINFSDTLPAGLQIVSVAANGCSGTPTISADGRTISLTGGTLVGQNADGSGKHSCQISIKIKATGVCGVYKNTKDNFSNVTNLDVSGINQQIEVTGCTPPEELCSVTTKEIACKEDGSGGHLYTFTVTNNTGHVVTDILLTPPANSNFTLSQQQFSLLPAGLASGASLTLQVTINGGQPEQPACFDVTLMTKEGECCTTRVCPVLRECCGIVRNVSIECNQDGTFTYTLSVVNTGVDTIEHIYLYPPAGVTMTPNYFPKSLKPGETFTTKVIIKGAKPGDTLCFDISLHTANMAKCCKGHHCILLPKCPVGVR
jgi:uncharacterized repeat protein (TIGR01451 family)/fimbrial isopeptide formation D2 family protein